MTEVPPLGGGPRGLPGRGDRMGDRLDRMLTAGGIHVLQRAQVMAVHRLAMEARDAALDGGRLGEGRLDDDHDPRYLHPGRTLLVFWEMATEADPPVDRAALVSLLPVAPLIDSRDPELRPSDARIDARINTPIHARIEERGQDLGERVRRVQEVATAGGTPVPDPSAWLEAVLPEAAGVQVLVLAEAFDHARHLHVGGGPVEGKPQDPRRAYAAFVGEALVPLAARIGGTAHRRLEWWWRRVGQSMAG